MKSISLNTEMRCIRRFCVDCGSVVYEWANSSGRLIAVVEAYVKKMCEQRLKGKAVEQVKTVNEGTLRNKVIELLDVHPGIE